MPFYLATFQNANAKGVGDIMYTSSVKKIKEYQSKKDRHLHAQRVCRSNNVNILAAPTLLAEVLFRSLCAINERP